MTGDAFRRKVLMIVPGGLEHGGGIGRMVGYMLQAWKVRPDYPDVVIVDPRGPGSILFFPLYLAKSLLTISANIFNRPLVHIHAAGRGSALRKFFVVNLASALGMPTILHLHDYNFRAFCAQLPASAFKLIKYMFRRADHIIVLGSSDYELMLSDLRLEPKRVTIIPNAVPAPPAATPETTPDANGVRILFLGNLSRRKGVHDLVDALASARLARLPWRATLAGGGHELETFREQATRTGVADKIDFLGWLPTPEVRGLLASSDILVLPSYDEGLAMSVLEGMSYGLAIVCTPVGALAEAIEDSVSGLIVRPGDVDGLSLALWRCIDDAALRKRLRLGARKRFAAQYDVQLYPPRYWPFMMHP